MMSVEESKEWSIQEFAGYKIRQRKNGYFSATDMCKVNNKEWKHYKENKHTKLCLNALGLAVGIPTAELIESITANRPDRGTWVHPRVAIHLAQWISPEFAVQVTDWVLRFMSGDLSLVKEVVQRHDKINNTKSKVYIDTISKELADKSQKLELCETRIQTLTNTLDEIKNREDEERERRKALTCQYCNRTYSSNSGITNHVRNNCDENKKAQFCLNIDIDRFMTFIDVLDEKWSHIANDYAFTLEKVDWESDKPKLKIICGKKIYTYHVYKNASRLKICNILNRKYTVPMDLLLSNPSAQFAEGNKIAHHLLSDFYRGGDALMVDDFKQKLGIRAEEEDPEEDDDD